MRRVFLLPWIFFFLFFLILGGEAFSFVWLGLCKWIPFEDFFGDFFLRGTAECEDAGIFLVGFEWVTVIKSFAGD